MNEQTQKILIIMGLALVTGFVFSPVVGHEFIQYDDYDYVVDNPHVQDGITWDTLRWAFISFDDGLWAPLARVSHALDVQIFGMHPGGHHFTNLVLHALNAALLFLFLTRATGMTWPSAFAAACFALHPLHVEPVAWIASRKDMLSGLFVLLTLLAYDGYAKRPTIWKIAWVTLGCLCAMMAKPAAVTLPLGLMLLDYWPYQRWQNFKSLSRLLLEKTPMLALAAGLCVITILAEQQGITSIENLPLGARINHAIVAYGLYVIKTVIPYPLWIPVMPTPEFATGIRVIGSATLLLTISTAVGLAWRIGAQGAPCGEKMIGARGAPCGEKMIGARGAPCGEIGAQGAPCGEIGARGAPYIVGWLWFLGMLVPVIGLVSFGHHVMADRFTYLPHIGLTLALAQVIGNIPHRWPKTATFLPSVMILLLAVFGGLSMIQVRYWHDTGSLFRHTLSADPDNYVALCNVSHDLMLHNRAEEALPLIQRACTINPKNPDASNDLGAAYLALGRYDEAIKTFTDVVRQKPGDPDVYVNLGAALLAKGDLAAAREQAMKALALDPNTPKAHLLMEQASPPVSSP